MWQSRPQFFAALSSVRGCPIASVRLDPDFVPAFECAEFEHGIGARDFDERTTTHRTHASGVEPEWSAGRGRPYVDGLAVRVDCGERVVFPLEYLADAVSGAATRLVEAGELDVGQRFAYDIVAVVERARPEAQSDAIDVVALEPTPPIEPVELAPLLARAKRGPLTRRAAAPRAADGPMPIVIAGRVIEEAIAGARASSELETGGILIGKLCRDSDGTLFAWITAQIPATHTEATRQSLRFTPQTWVDVDAALALRKRGEMTLGWWHSHPEFCATCPPARRTSCPYSAPFFSADDRLLHREVFQKPWNVALLLSFLGEHRPSCNVFAWNRGLIKETGFFTLEEKIG